MVDDIPIDRREDTPTHFLVVAVNCGGLGASRTIRQETTEALAINGAMAFAAQGHKATVYRAIAEYEPVLAVKPRGDET